MTDFPNTQNTGNLIDFISKIGDIGTPEKLTTGSISDYGYTSSNDRSIVSVFKYIGLTDDSGAPTNRWRKARADSKVAVAEGVIEGYTSLYSIYPNAHDRDTETLNNFFKSKTDVGEATLRRILATFRSLADYGKFDEARETGSVDRTDAEGSNEKMEKSGGQVYEATLRSKSGMMINLNVELTLPPDENGKVYEAFFKAMRKHLIDADV